MQHIMNALRRERKIVALSTLATLVVVGTVGTLLIMRGSSSHVPGQTANKRATPTMQVATATTTATIPPVAADPGANGWTAVSAARFGDVRFAASDPRRGYLCGGATDNDTKRVFGVTSDGGQTWQIENSPAAYATCVLQISPTNALQVSVTSINEPGEGQTAFVEAHYSSDGGQTWKQAPIPQDTTGLSYTLWSGPYLYVIVGPSKGQPGSIQVSANGGTFTQIDMSTLLPGVQSVGLVGATASSDRVYLTVQHSDCAAPCISIVASADGGKTWTQIPNQSNIQLNYAQGMTLYGTVMSVQPVPLLSVMRSTDGGATWSAITLPALPSGAAFDGFVLAPDGTICTFTPSSVFYSRGGVWTAIPFTSSSSDSVVITAISVDAGGAPTKVWGDDGGAHLGLYWHSI